MRKWIGWALLGVVVLGWFVWLRPTALGGDTSMVVVSGSSMEPTLMPGDLVVTRATDDYAVGDVAVYTIPEGQPGDSVDANIVHRLVGEGPGGGFRTQGDNLEDPDPWRPGPDDIVGTVWFHVPHGGQGLLWLLQPGVIAGLAGAVTVYLMMGWRRPDTRPQAPAA